jgi:hypothetical protein
VATTAFGARAANKLMLAKTALKRLEEKAAGYP